MKRTNDPLRLDSGEKNNPGRNAIAVNPCQEGNGILTYIRKVPWGFSSVKGDYRINSHLYVLFLSLKYYRLKPEYIYVRVKEFNNTEFQKFLLCLVDVQDHRESIRDLARICVLNNITMLLSWSMEEAGGILETLKLYEFKSADSIQRRMPTNTSNINGVLSNIKSLTKNDTAALLARFKCLRNIMLASEADLQGIPGIGEKKIQCIMDAFRQPFTNY